MSISIHVPSWGTTLRCIRWYRTVRISIHVPSWGTTAQAGYNQWDNPISIHVPSWGTTDLTSKQKAFADISIHVPSWGTTGAITSGSSSRVFQSTFPRGERPRMNTGILLEYYFNPRSLVGNDYPVHCNKSTAEYFNPRSLVGNDIVLQFRNICFFISIHVPSWGTTANFHKYSLFFYAINIIFLLFIIPSLFSLVLFMLLF